MEMIDIFDKDFHWIGTAAKDVAHAKGIWHQTFQCWIVRKRENQCFILFQKRAACKEDSPGLFDISAAGHLLVGESKEQGVREIKEELGVEINPANLVYLGVRVAQYAYHNIINQEFCHVYLLEDNRALFEYLLLESEVDCLLELNILDVLDLFCGKIDKACGQNYSMKNGIEYVNDILVSMNNFIPRYDLYYEKISQIALDYFAGRKVESKIFGYLPE